MAVQRASHVSLAVRRMLRRSRSSRGDTVQTTHRAALAAGGVRTGRRWALANALAGVNGPFSRVVERVAKGEEEWKKKSRGRGRGRGGQAGGGSVRILGPEPDHAHTPAANSTSASPVHTTSPTPEAVGAGDDYGARLLPPPPSSGRRVRGGHESALLITVRHHLPTREPGFSSSPAGKHAAAVTGRLIASPSPSPRYGACRQDRCMMLMMTMMSNTAIWLRVCLPLCRSAANTEYNIALGFGSNEETQLGRGHPSRASWRTWSVHGDVASPAPRPCIAAGGLPVARAHRRVDNGHDALAWLWLWAWVVSP